MAITQAPKGMKHLSRGRLEGDEFDTMCDNPHCTDPGCEGTCIVVGLDGTVLQNLKQPLDPNTCRHCWENPCDCGFLWPDWPEPDCPSCHGSPCCCEPADDANYDPDEDYWLDPESRADNDDRASDGLEYLQDAIFAGELASMSPEERAEALRHDRINLLGFDPDAI